MQEFKINSTNFPFVFSGILIFISTVFLIIAISMGYKTINTKLNTDTYTVSTHVEINSHWSQDSDGHSTMMYSPVFFYNVNGKEYSCSTGSSSSSKPNIINSKIFYNSQNPNYCISEYDFTQDLILDSIFFIIALPEFIIGIYMLICALIGRNKIKRLKQKGQLIKNIPCTIIPTNYTYNNKQGYNIVLEYQGLKQNMILTQEELQQIY